MKEDKGYVMVLALVIASALLILLSTITGTIIIQRRLVDRSYHRERALALAESGIDIAIACLNEKDISEPYPEISEEIPEMGTFQVNFSDSTGSTITLTSTGYSKREEKKKAKRTVEVTANLTMKGTIFEYAIASREDIKIKDATIVGDIIAVGSIENSGSTVNGTVTEGAEWLEFPEFDSDYYKTNANMVKSGDWVIENGYSFEDNKIIYVEGGDVEIKGFTLTGPGVIIAEGKIEVKTGAEVGTSSVPVGLISISGGIEIKENSTIYGFVISSGSQGIEVKSSEITHDLGFGPEIYTYFKGNYLITIWSEIL